MKWPFCIKWKSAVTKPAPAALRARVILRVESNAAATNQRVALPSSLLVALFGEDLSERLAQRRTKNGTRDSNA